MTNSFNKVERLVRMVRSYKQAAEKGDHETMVGLHDSFLREYNTRGMNEHQKAMAEGAKDLLYKIQAKSKNNLK